MIKIDKTISRDLPLTNIYAWHKGYTDGLKKWLGWSYSDSLFYVHDGYVDIMRPPVEHLEQFKIEILKKIESDPTWFSSEQEKFLLYVDEIYTFYDSIGEIGDLSNKQLWEIYTKYVEYITHIMGPFITMIWLPIWMEKDSEGQNKYAKEIELGIDGRKKSEQIFPKGDILILKILSRLENELKLSTKLVKMVSYSELENFLINRIESKLEDLEARLRGFIYGKHGILLIGDSKISDAFASLGYEYSIQDYSDVKELKGSVACTGKISGKVRIIMSKDKISEVEVGDILVASMTTPEYMPAMLKAVAFITDEGGITCHAAIVARELKKPCIIGTKIATKVLKDGDLVEVDADKGTVKIISHK